MKKLFFLVVALLGFQLASAQAWTGKGDQKLQIGFNGWGNGTGITGTYDYGVGGIVSLGAGANIYFSDYKDNNKDNNFFVFGRVNFHLRDVLNMPKEMDLYPGLDVGVLGDTFGLGAHLGFRYFFSPNVGAFIEAGNNGSIGLSFNF
ncbi:MAG: hypothetical protein EAS48_01520 [Chryseobacterium sp.]|nr:MAG: hypothetical protein EAS48_01520 [Chryseobacterium sp.]